MCLMWNILRYLYWIDLLSSRSFGGCGSPERIAGCTVFILPVVSLVGVVVLKEVVGCVIFCISVPVVLCVLV